MLLSRLLRWSALSEREDTFLTHDGQLTSGEFGVIVLQAGEQMPVHVKGHLDLALARGRFGRADLAPKVCALAHADDVAIEIDGIPGEAAKLGSAHAGKYHCHEERTPSPLGRREDGLNLF